MTRPDPRFFANRAPLPAKEACVIAGAVLHGDAGPVTHAGSLTTGGEGAVVFVAKAQSVADRRNGAAALVLTSLAAKDAVREAFPQAAIGIADRPKLAFARLAAALHQSLIDIVPPLAAISPDARIAATAEVAPSAVIGSGTLIHDGVVVAPFALIGPGVVLDEGTRIGPHATVTHAVIGKRCVLSAGVRIGEAGFGYVPGPEGAEPLPQLGRVILGDRVDIGANTTVDRGTLGDTVIGDGTKIDNLCQVAHNCRVGRGVLIASQTGLSGSVVIGDSAMIGGQVGMADHLKVGDRAVLSAGSGLMRDVPEGERWGGRPAKPAREWMREVAAVSRLVKGKGKEPKT